MVIRARKRARVAEWAALEMRYTRKGIGGSNPPASAQRANRMLGSKKIRNTTTS